MSGIGLRSGRQSRPEALVNGQPEEFDIRLSVDGNAALLGPVRVTATPRDVLYIPL